MSGPSVQGTMYSMLACRSAALLIIVQHMQVFAIMQDERERDTARAREREREREREMQILALKVCEKRSIAKIVCYSTSKFS